MLEPENSFISDELGKISIHILDTVPVKQPHATYILFLESGLNLE
jgi:hypothetical protein